MIVGLTGGIGSGKTAVSDWFLSQNIEVVDADMIAHKITERDSPLLDALKDNFGDWVLDANGNYNRQAMRQFIFSNPDKLTQLNAIIHPAIQQNVLNHLKQSHSIYTLLVAPLLFENRKQSPLFDLCQRFLVVDSPVELQRQRANRRDKSDVDAIIQRQISRPERLALARKLNADIIANDSTLDKLHQRLVPLHQKYLTIAKKTN